MLKEYRSGTQDIKLYRRVKLSGVAAAKILLHAKRGCDEGIAASGTPTEIMGMLFGYAYFCRVRGRNDPGRCELFFDSRSLSQNELGRPR